MPASAAATGSPERSGAAAASHVTVRGKPQPAAAADRVRRGLEHTEIFNLPLMVVVHAAAFFHPDLQHARI
jgi:hypothetical protein